jgi:predicted nucleic acid-binding protein
MAGLRRGMTGALVLDADGLTKLATGNALARARFEVARRHRRHIVTSASTLAEVLRGGPRDAELHHVLKDVEVIEIDRQHGRAAGELLGKTGLSGHRCALDALLAVIAMAQPRPVVLLTNDPRDLEKLTEEPERAKAERIAVLKVLCRLGGGAPPNRHEG